MFIFNLAANQRKDTLLSLFRQLCVFDPEELKMISQVIFGVASSAPQTQRHASTINVQYFTFRFFRQLFSPNKGLHLNLLGMRDCVQSCSTCSTSRYIVCLILYRFCFYFFFQNIISRDVPLSESSLFCFFRFVIF